MKKSSFLLLLLALLGFSGCEKDDICDGNTPTTPRLIVDFYDITNPAVPKEVTDLKVVGEGMEEGVVFNPGAEGEYVYLANSSRISIPLRTANDQTVYNFTLNSGNADPNLVFTDKISLNYLRKESYVSRACGFKTTFSLNGQSNPLKGISLENGTTTSGNWIREIEIETTEIENENEAHIRIYF